MPCITLYARSDDEVVVADASSLAGEYEWAKEYKYELNKDKPHFFLRSAHLSIDSCLMCPCSLATSIPGAVLLKDGLQLYILAHAFQWGVTSASLSPLEKSSAPAQNIINSYQSSSSTCKYYPHVHTTL